MTASKEMMSDRKRHQDKDIEPVMVLAEGHGWRFSRNKKYWMGFCPCGVHHKTVHLSPSNPDYAKNLQKWFERQPCWTEGSRP